MPHKRKSKLTQPKPAPPPPYETPTSRGTKRRRQSSEAETEDRAILNRTPAVPKTPNGLMTMNSPEDQLQREVQENGSHPGLRSAKRQKRQKSDFSYCDIQFKYRIISGPGKDTPRKKRRVDRDEGKKHVDDSPTSIAQKTRVPPLIDSLRAPIATNSRPKIPPAGPSSFTPNPPKKQQHNSGRQSYTEHRPRAPPSVFPSRAVKPSRSAPPTKPSSVELLGDAGTKKRGGTEREERSARRGGGEDQKKGGESSTSSAKPTPAKPDARTRGHIQSASKTPGRESKHQESARGKRDSGPVTPHEPLAMGSAQRPPAKGSVVATGTAAAGPANKIGSGEQDKLTKIMRAREDAAKKGVQAAKLWAEQQKAKGKSTTK